VHFRESRQSALELGQIVADLEPVLGHEFGTGFWPMIQEFKATVLTYRQVRISPVGESVLKNI